ncbi:hypothetical protein [Aliterella atlantica]|uniref:Uncharacterized protein n=1 Tax=Aliterella atlantica CENA595 TaxID=1618023 RepID=A0A0D8ZLX6_9CYAN|nr:hypothetical protein [Aliterella atlantica]KJH69402.1 hypothetical protein UH38_24165 [Aliterella atlantica CENA595]
MNTVVVWAGLIGTTLGIITSVLGCVALYRTSVIKGYAAQRDYEHLKNYYKSLSEAFKFQTETFEHEFREVRKDIDTRSDRIDQNQIEIKALLLSNLRLRPSLKEDE